MTALPPLARRVATYQPSAVRAVFAKANAPGMISLAGGAPYLADLPWETIADEARAILQREGPVALQYSFGVGIPQLRAALTDVMAMEDIRVGPDDVIVTTGSQQALDALCKVMVDPGDVVITEGPCYSGGLSAILSYQAQVRHAATDHDGVQPQDVARLIDEARAAGGTVKFVYCIPTYQNPGNTVLPLGRRRELVDVCASRGVLLVEDNAYGLLGFDGATMPSLREMNPDGVAYLGSLSKMFAPGLRLGWAVVPQQMRRAMIDTVETTVLNPPTLNQMLVTHYLTESDWRTTLSHMRQLYRGRCDALVTAVRGSGPADLDVPMPTGGFYLWLRLPEGVDSPTLLDRAIERGVVFVPGTAFYTDGQGRAEVRLSYCLPTTEQLRQAGGIVGELICEAARA